MADLDALIAEFNGAIKYKPMLADHPHWTHDQCIAEAHRFHALAILGLRRAWVIEKETRVSWMSQSPIWNDGIPYCRNQPTLRMMEEAIK